MVRVNADNTKENDMYSGVREIFTIPAINQNDILVFQLHDSCSMAVGEQLTTKIKQDMAQFYRKEI